MRKHILSLVIICILLLPLALVACETSSVDVVPTQQVLQKIPPRHFYDRAELTQWRQAVGVVGLNMSYVDAVLELQRIALGDGYIVSIDIDWDESVEYWGLTLTALAGDGFYSIYPDDLTVTWFCDVR